MRHLDPETLALRALGERVLDDAGETHVLTCRTCRDELDGLLRTTIALRRAGAEEAGNADAVGRPPQDRRPGTEPVDLGRLEVELDLDSPADGGEAVTPPAHVWAAIAHELDLDPALAAGLSADLTADLAGDLTGNPPEVPPLPTTPGVTEHRPPAPAAGPQPVGAPAPPSGSAAPGTPSHPRHEARESAHGTPDELTRRRARSGRRRRSRPSALLAAAAASAVVAGAGGSVLTAVALRDGADQPSRTPVLAAALTPVAGSAAEPVGTGDAAVLRGDSSPDETTTGDVVLQVDVSDLPASPGYHGVWLIDEATGDMVAVGVLPEGTRSAAFGLPDGLDLDAYALVDISDEPLDGDPTHSGVSLLRGTLST